MILLPTLNRIELLKRFLTSVRDTNCTTPGIVLADSNDIENHKKEYNDLELPHGWSFANTGKNVSMGDKVRHAFEFLMPDNLKWVGILNDDHVCITPEWDKKVEALIDGTNMVSTNDGNWNFGVRVCGLTAWSTGLLEAVGFPIYPRNLQHLYIDDVWKAIGESTGCWLETNKVNIEHRHVYLGKMEQDETFKKVNLAASWEYDAKEFKQFLEQDFKDVCARVSALRQAHAQKQKFG